MRVIIAGGRDFADHERLARVLDDMYADHLRRTNSEQFSVVCGMARGADQLGHDWATFAGVAIEEYPAEWDKHGKAAGHKRNLQMALNAEVLVAFWDGMSSGTRDMIQTALAHGLEVHVYRYDPPQIEERF